MVYHYADFGDFSFSRFGFIAQTDKHTDIQKELQTEADDRFSGGTTVGVSNKTGKPEIIRKCDKNDNNNNNKNKEQIALKICRIRHSMSDDCALKSNDWFAITHRR